MPGGARRSRPRRWRRSDRRVVGHQGPHRQDPDSENITNTTVTPGNAGDASVATDLIGDLSGNGCGQRLPGHPPQSRTQARTPHASTTRRTPSTRARHPQSRRRLQPPCGCRQRGQSGRARPAFDPDRLGHHMTDQHNNPHPGPRPKTRPDSTRHPTPSHTPHRSAASLMSPNRHHPLSNDPRSTPAT